MTDEVTPGINATESAIELARELGINIAAIKGTGEDGRVLKKDVEALGITVMPEAQDVEIAISTPGRTPQPRVRVAPPGARPTHYRFRRHIDKFRPGDLVPEGVYSDAELAGMLRSGAVE